MKHYLARFKKRLGKRLRKKKTQLQRAYDVWKYRAIKPYHVFTIRADDLEFKMTFRDYPLDHTIVERIEGRRDPIQVALIKSLVPEGTRVLEIGGCYGYFTSIMSLCAGNTGRVISVEGTPNNFTILQGNMHLNKFANVELHNFFVASTANPDIGFLTGERNPYAAIKRMQDQTAATVPVTHVPIKRVTSFLRDIQYVPDIIFMDIEGFEVDVIDDLAAQMLKLHRPTIYFEIHKGFYKPGKDLKYLQQLLRQQDYAFRQIGNNLICFPNKKSKQ